jgi:hypothetical protein
MTARRARPMHDEAEEAAARCLGRAARERRGGEEGA